MVLISRVNEISEKVGNYYNTFYESTTGETDIQNLQKNKVMALVKEALKAPMYQEIYSEDLKQKIIECNDPDVFIEEIFPQLPIITKSILLKYNTTCFTIDRNKFLHYYESSGTTGIPVPASKTIDDFIWNTVNIGEMWGSFLNQDDVAIILINAPFAPAPYQMEKVAEYIGMMSYRPYVDNLTGNHTRVLKLMDETNTNVFIGPASGLIELYEYALKNNLPTPRLEKILLLGEQSGKAFLRRLEKLTGGWVSVGTYGSSETATICAACKDKELHAFTHSQYLELKNGEECFPISERVNRGELIVTTLDFLSKPLIRYNTGDVVEFDFSPCECGSVLPKIYTQGRAVDVISFQKSEITQEDIEEVIWSDDIVNPSIFNYMFMIKDNSIIFFFTSESVPTKQWEKNLENKLLSIFKDKKVLVKNVEKLPPLNSISAYVGWKLSRVLDLNEAKNWDRLVEPIGSIVRNSFKQLQDEIGGISDL